jgi:hypothetical protein
MLNVSDLRSKSYFQANDGNGLLEDIEKKAKLLFHEGKNTACTESQALFSGAAAPGPGFIGQRRVARSRRASICPQAFMR